MNWHSIGYALACVAVPVAWGLLVVWVSNRLDRELLRRGGAERPPAAPIEYHI